ncbi:9441_t:CDS:1 [Acaulospora morrowiae]|uniref:9441_t:CDS:1 n=1 Tax=Acaulospora morrowiae TaxID=94023 RepID=A0A9N9DX41_9GLOM|nr:9441_t:CDS:1 [Acaulospora morrowiae]
MTTFSQLNDLQRKSLVDLFAYIKHFNQNFTAAALDGNSSTSFLENMKSTSASLFTHFIYQSNVTVDQKTFKTLRQENKEWDEEIKKFKKFVALLNKGSNKQLINKGFCRRVYEPSGIDDSGNEELLSENSTTRKEVRERDIENNAWEKENEKREGETKEVNNHRDEKVKRKSTQNSQRKLDKKHNMMSKEKDELLKEKSMLIKEKDELLKVKDEVLKRKEGISKIKDDLVKEKERTKKYLNSSKERGINDRNVNANKKGKNYLATFLRKEDAETDDSCEQRFDVHKRKVRCTPQLLIDESEVEDMADLVKFGYISKAEYMMKRFEEINQKVKKHKNDEDGKIMGTKKNKKRNHV